MKIKIEIETSNEAMQTWEDVKKAITYRLKNYEGEVTLPELRLISDENGNTIGKMEVSESDDNDDLCTLCKKNERDTYENYYECERCKETWQNSDSSACNDKCPNCNIETEPWQSIPV